jgi:acetyl esterase/lipase
VNTDVLVDKNAIDVPVARLWPQRAPQAAGDDLLDQPMISIHIPESGNGCGIIVAPGGGYRTLASDHEGLQVAKWLNRLGIAAFVLRYRLGPTYHSSVSLLDAQRAIRYVRQRAAEFNLSAGRVGMLGFSAGGHLSCAAATAWDEGEPDHHDPVERQSCKPDFIAPIYAVTNGAKRGRKADEYHPVDEAVTSTTPPAFIVTTHEDSIVPANQSTLYYDAMLAAGVAAELHIFNDGEHGLGLMPGDPDAGQWTGLLVRWLRRRGFLTAAPRVEVSGSLLIDGVPPGLAWVTFLPETSDQPIARVRINRAGGGRFEIPAETGPTTGWHEMQIHHVSDQYPHEGTGVFTMPDARIYRKRVHIDANQQLEVHLVDDDFEAIADNG